MQPISATAGWGWGVGRGALTGGGKPEGSEFGPQRQAVDLRGGHV